MFRNSRGTISVGAGKIIQSNAHMLQAGTVGLCVLFINSPAEKSPSIFFLYSCLLRQLRETFNPIWGGGGGFVIHAL